MVKAILKFDNTTALYHNIDGQTPLHSGVAQGYNSIAKELLETPQRGGLFLEDCIGQTPLELAALKELLSRLKKSHRERIDTLGSDNYVDGTDRIAPHRIEEQLPLLKKVVKQMIDEGKPKDPQKFNFDMTAFANLLESNLEQWKQKLAALPPKPEPKEEKVNENPTESENVDATWNAVHGALVAAVEAGETRRELAKLLDVQQSVKARLDEVSKKKKTVDYDSDAEEDPEDVEAGQCMFHIPRSTSHL
jgi:ankyrin repeat protein